MRKDDILIDIPDIENMGQTELAEKLEGWFYENGCLPFEHGFQSIDLTICGRKCKISMVDESGVSFKEIGGPVFKCRFDELSDTRLIAIITECNRYYNYCLYEA